MKALKSIVPAVLLAVVMFISSSVDAYAASVSRDDCMRFILSFSPEIEFSNYYFDAVIDSTGQECFGFIVSSAVSEYDMFCFFRSSTVINGETLDVLVPCNALSDGTVEALPSSLYFFHQVLLRNDGSLPYSYSSGKDCINSYLFRTFSTNVPVFTSRDAVSDYVLTGDTSGLENPFALGLTVYDSSVEVPKDLKIEMGAQMKAFFSGDTLHSGSYGLEDCLFTWKQSAEALEAAEAEGLRYKTEIYYQQTILAADSHFYDRKYRLSNSELVGVKDVTSVESSYSASISVFDEIMQHWISSGSIPSGVFFRTNTYPAYFYVRNVLGYKHSNWVKVTLDENGFTETNISNGYSVVTGGYDEIDGNTNLPGSGSSLKGDSVSDSQYGSDYKIDVGSVDTKDFMNNIKRGFGLLGDDGLIALLREFFSFVPNEYFVVLVGFISAAAVVAVFKLLF
ncbi:MAG: hypothetical protein NC131_12525 [Roseburia sp.]|nr:hypothetical protein [Roseburia sp.]